MARHIRKKSAGRKSAVTRLQREQKELAHMLESCRAQLRRAGLPVRFPRFRKDEFTKKKRKPHAE